MSLRILAPIMCALLQRLCCGWREGGRGREGGREGGRGGRGREGGGGREGGREEGRERGEGGREGGREEGEREKRRMEYLFHTFRHFLKLTSICLSLKPVKHITVPSMVQE